MHIRICSDTPCIIIFHVCDSRSLFGNHVSIVLLERQMCFLQSIQLLLLFMNAILQQFQSIIKDID